MGIFHTAAPPALHINVSLHLLVSASARVSTGGQRSSSGFSPVLLPNILSAHLPTPTSLSLFVPLAFPKPHSRRRVDTQRVWQWSLRHGNDKQGKISSVAGRAREEDRRRERERERELAGSQECQHPDKELWQLGWKISLLLTPLSSVCHPSGALHESARRASPP